MSIAGEKRVALSEGWSVLGLRCLCLAAAVMLHSHAVAQDVVDRWRYTVQHPEGAWQQEGYDDSAWSEGAGGFGTGGTPGARVGTVWRTKNIWLRKRFQLSKIPEEPALLIHHDEDAEVYLNGARCAAFSGWLPDYKVVQLDNAQSKALRLGDNLMAVSCRQTDGGQFIDVHVIDAANAPILPRPKPITEPFRSDLLTDWGTRVSAENVWNEYPRPQLVRPEWQNLNGYWDYAITDAEMRDAPTEWAGKILVPFCLESRLGGVGRLLDPSEALWYRRKFEVTRQPERRVLLHFEAVDYRCEVSVNGQPVGSHRGGHTPFAFDVTDALANGENTLTVRVEDDTEGWQLRGKQVLEPKGVWYTRVSGIWQTVWLETVPESYLKDLRIATDADSRSITVRPILVGHQADLSVRVLVKDRDVVVASGESRGEDVTLTVSDAKLWSPASPHLYDLEVSVTDSEGEAIDQVASYAGIRSVGKARDADGQWRFTLNGQPLFHWGTLDQGWWPDGLLTPPSDEAMLYDIEFLKSAGFNMIRKHIKVEPRRYYYHCDRLGMLLWQDHVSGGPTAAWTRLEPEPVDAVWPDERHRQFTRELDRMVGTLENHPSIVVWVPFNESWGQHSTLDVGHWLAGRDPSRSLNIASGGNFWPVGDVVDAHKYPHPGFPFEQGPAGRFDNFVKVVGEFGGHGLPVEGHLWDADRNNWGYGGLPKSRSELIQRYEESLRRLKGLRKRGIAAGVYTQTTDVEGEVNGLMTYDRKVIKIPADQLRQLQEAYVPLNN